MTAPRPSPFSAPARLLTSWLLALLAPRNDVLSPYARQWHPARTWTINIAGILAIALAGAFLGFQLVVLPPHLRIWLIAPLGLLALLVIWVLPDHDRPPTRLMTGAFLGFIVVAIVWPDYVAFNIPGLPWISMRRLFLAPMMLALAISVSISRSFRAAMMDYLSEIPLFWKMLALFVLIQFISMPMAKEHTGALKNFVNDQALWTGSFLVGVYAFQKPHMIDRVIRTLLICGCVVATIAFFESRAQRVLWIGHVPGFLGIDPEVLDLFTGSRFRDGQYRARATFTNPLPYAELLAMISMICVYYALRVRSIWARLAFALLDLALLGALLLAQARLGVAGYIIGHAAFGLLWALRRWRANRASLIGPAVTLAYPVMLIAMMVAISSISFLSNRVLGSAATQGSNDARVHQFKNAVPHILKSPVFGYGPQQGALVLDFRISEFRTIDSYILSMLLDYGLVGFILYFGMIGLGMHRLLRLLLLDEGKTSDTALLIVAMLSAFLFTRTVLSQEDNNWLPFVLLGMAVALVRHHRLDSEVRPHG